MAVASDFARLSLTGLLFVGVWISALVYYATSSRYERDFFKEGIHAPLDHRLEEAEDAQYREDVELAAANAGPAPTSRDRLWGHAFSVGTFLVCVAGCIAYVPHWGLIPIVVSLVTILMGLHVGQGLPGHLARRRAHRASAANKPYSPRS